MTKERIPLRARSFCTVTEIAEETPLGKNKIYEMINDGRLKSKMVDCRRIIDVPSLLKVLGDE